MSSHTVSDYLLGRLAELGADTIFGVPGDHTLQLLDHIVDHGQVGWAAAPPAESADAEPDHPRRGSWP